MKPAQPSRPSICARCLRCLRQRRAYSSTAPTAPPPAAGYARLSNRRLVSLHGPDAPKLLQGLTTNSLHPSWTTGWYSAFLTSQGRVLWDVFVYPTAWSRQYKDWLDAGGAGGKTRQEGDWSCFVELDADVADACVRHLRRHKLRSKVEIRLVGEGEWDVFAAWDDSAAAAQAASTSENTLQSVPSPSSPITLADPRVQRFGHRMLLPAQQSTPASSIIASVYPGRALSRTDLQTYTLRRYLAGVAEGQAEILGEQALPQESNIDYMHGVDFRKGCYVGQELTIRTHHTGVVRKRILPVQLYHGGGGGSSSSSSSSEQAPAELSYDPTWAAAADERPPALPPRGAGIKKAAGKGRGAGKFLAGIGNVGLALCRLEMMTDVRLTAEGGSFAPGDEFRLAWEGAPEDLRVRAFVPEWHGGKGEVRRWAGGEWSGGLGGWGE